MEIGIEALHAHSAWRGNWECPGSAATSATRSPEVDIPYKKVHSWSWNMLSPCVQFLMVLANQILRTCGRSHLHVSHSAFLACYACTCSDLQWRQYRCPLDLIWKRHKYKKAKFQIKWKETQELQSLFLKW